MTLHNHNRIPRNIVDKIANFVGPIICRNEKGPQYPTIMYKLSVSCTNNPLSTPRHPQALPTLYQSTKMGQYTKQQSCKCFPPIGEIHRERTCSASWIVQPHFKRNKHWHINGSTLYTVPRWLGASRDPSQLGYVFQYFHGI